MFTTELLKNIPALYSQDGKGKEAIVYMHIEALNGWQWFITEYDGKELISNISLRTVNYYSNRDFYTKIKEDIRKTTIILNEYKNFINNHQF